MAIVKLVEIECGSCGVLHAIPESLYEKCKSEGGFWHCPNGHRRGWSEGSVYRERDRLKQRVAQMEDELREQAALTSQAVEQRDKEKKKRVRLEQRTGAGMCPCCNRTVSQLARHMKSKHPEMVPASNVVPIKKGA